MTKEIREVIDLYTEDRCLYPDRECSHRASTVLYCSNSDCAYRCLIERLDSVGVVLKVEGELPEYRLNDDCSAFCHAAERDDLFRAGYTHKFERLI